MIAVSGGPDSTALLVLASRWVRRQKKRSPKFIAVTVDHGLRPQAAAEAAAVKRLARNLGVAHTTLRWREKKPKSGLQDAARVARYRLLAQAAKRAGCAHVMTAHTLDDQAETVLFRLARGSGLTGLAGMATTSLLPVGDSEIFLLRPLLHIPKLRLVETLRAAGIAYADDPSNSDPRFTRARLRALMPALRVRGLTRGVCPGSRSGCGVPKRRSNLPCVPRAPRSRPALGIRMPQSTLTVRASRSCRPRSGCASSGEPLRMRVTRAPLNLVNSKCFTMPCGRRPAGCAERLPARWLLLRPIGSESSVRPRAALQPCAKSARAALRNRFILPFEIPFWDPWFPLFRGGPVPTFDGRDVKPPRFAAERAERHRGAAQSRSRI